VSLFIILIFSDVNKRKNVYLDMVVDWAKSIGKEDLEFIQLNAADVLIAVSLENTGIGISFFLLTQTEFY
jgi:hypothetical protein